MTEGRFSMNGPSGRYPVGSEHLSDYIRAAKRMTADDEVQDLIPFDFMYVEPRSQRSVTGSGLEMLFFSLSLKIQARSKRLGR